MEKQSSGLNGMLATKAAASYTGIHIRRFQDFLKVRGNERIPHYTIGARAYFKTEDLDNWLEQRKK